MTFKEFKDIINSMEVEDGARMYVEMPLEERAYLQAFVSSVRKEEGTLGTSVFVTIE